MSNSVEERVAELEEKVEYLFRKLRAIEKTIEALGINPEIPATIALEASRRIVETIKTMGGRDDISLAIIEALGDCNPLTISELTRKVRTLRGKASRRIIRERVRKLIEANVLATVVEGRRVKVVLAKCLEKQKHTS
ncbi:MAG: hypothetical protein B6U76_10765 [Desulfurococcales archaeon ex4484_217_2]|nr:MAG: hypothetical protein B6U76_10765 [Desulfurococcales archaeon ex4484_217_2]